ncbi:hypothetical protein CC79DRAFT_819050 [Sarocladium strictum]
MAEILGAVAAAAQLTVTCLALMEITKRIKARTSTLENYQKQLLQLQYISESISSNPLLQTPEIELHTRNILSLLSEHNLEPSLKRHRVSQIILFFSQDRAISRLFIDLERQKANLTLVVNEVQSRALHQIQSSISTMSDQRGTEKRKSGKGKRVAMEDVGSQFRSRRSHALPSSPDPLHSGNVIPFRPQPQLEGPSGESQEEPRVAADESDTASQSSAPPGVPNPPPSWSKFNQLSYAAACIDLGRHYFKDSKPKASFIGCSAYGRGDMVNGTNIEHNSKITPQQAAAINDEETHYVACTAQNGGYLVNGVQLWTTEETEPEIYPATRGHYKACDLLEDDKDNNDERTTIINGVSYRNVNSKGGPSGSKKGSE